MQRPTASSAVPTKGTVCFWRTWSSNCRVWTIVPSISTRFSAVHELLFGEAGPPFVGLAILGVEDLLHHPVAGFVAQLQEILAHQVRILGSLRLGIDGVQGKTGIAGDVELGNGQAVHVLLSLSLAGGPIELLQALGDVERHIDEHAIHIGLERIRN